MERYEDGGNERVRDRAHLRNSGRRWGCRRKGAYARGKKKRVLLIIVIYAN
jgi:hypothetical protein